MVECKDGPENGDSDEAKDGIVTTSGEHGETSGRPTEDPDHKPSDVKSWTHSQNLNFDKAVFGLEQMRAALMKNLDAEKENLKKLTGLRDSYKK